MAIVLQKYELVVELFDAGGNFTRRTYEFRASDTAGDISALITSANTLITKLLAASNGVIKSARLCRVAINDAFNLPSVGEVEAHALITAPITGVPNKSASVDIPAPKDTIFVGAPGSGAAYNQVDFGDAAVTDFLDLFTGGSSQFLISDGESIVQENLKGKRTHSHSLKG